MPFIQLNFIYNDYKCIVYSWIKTIRTYDCFLNIFNILSVSSLQCALSTTSLLKLCISFSSSSFSLSSLIIMSVSHWVPFGSTHLSRYITILYHGKVDKQHIDNHDQIRSNHDRIQLYDHNDNVLPLNEALKYNNEIT